MLDRFLGHLNRGNSLNAIKDLTHPLNAIEILTTSLQCRSVAALLNKSEKDNTTPIGKT
jgi:hypothetical protein